MLKSPVWRKPVDDQEPKIHLSPYVTKGDLKNIIVSTLTDQFHIANSVIPGLDRFTLFEINDIFVGMLDHPHILEFDSIKPKSLLPFSVEEDYWLYTFIRLGNPSDFDILHKQFSDKFLPIRSKNDLLTRIKEISQYTDGQVNELIEKFTDIILQTKLKFLKSSLPTDNKFSHFQACEHSQEQNEFIAESSINSLTKFLPKLTCIFQPNELAILASDDIRYSMRQMRLLIGIRRNGYCCDIDLGVFESEKICHHVSKRQAVLSFLPDTQFYIENIGSAIFRVNGVIIPPNGVCIVPPMAVLDFCDRLMLFIPNKDLIGRIANDIRKQKRKGISDVPRPRITRVRLPFGHQLRP